MPYSCKQDQPSSRAEGLVTGVISRSQEAGSQWPPLRVVTEMPCEAPAGRAATYLGTCGRVCASREEQRSQRVPSLLVWPRRPQTALADHACLGTDSGSVYKQKVSVGYKEAGV